MRFVFAMEFGFAGIVLNKWIGGESDDDDLEQYSKTAAEWGADATMRWLRRYNSTRKFTIALRCLQATICTDYLIRAVALAGSSQSLPLDMSIREHFMAQIKT
jgi:hypothetical protein